MDSCLAATFDAHWRGARERLDAAIANGLAHFFDGLPAPHHAAVREVLDGGKRLRGCLVLLLNEALGGAPGAAIPRAIAVECVQAASLIHDDFIDGDTLRRDRPATWTVHGPRRAVLLGDLIFATALRRMAELGRDDGAVLAKAIATMAAGAYQEPLGSGEPAPDRATDAGSRGAQLYPQLIHLKTGVLFGAAAQLGALAAEAPAPVAAQAFEYGARIGEAYQIADDVRDWLGAPPAPAQCAVLAPALWHFCAEAGPPHGLRVPTPEEAERWRPVLRERMAAAVDVRLQQAVAAAALLRHGRHPVSQAGLLQAAPHAIVGAMLHAGP